MQDHGPMQGVRRRSSRCPARELTPDQCGNGHGTGNNNNGTGKISNLPTKNADPIRVKNNKPEGTIAPRRLFGNGNGNSSQHFGASQSRNSFNSMGGHGGFKH